MRKIRLKDDILEIITERYLTPVQYSMFEKHPNRIRKMVDAQSNETTLVKIEFATQEDASKMLIITFVIKLHSLEVTIDENLFVNLNEMEQRLESFTEDVIGTIDSWVKDEKMVITFIPGPYKVEAVKILKENLWIGLKEAKDCVDARQFECTEEQLKTIKPLLEKAGCRGFKKIGEEKPFDFTNASLEECRNQMQQIVKRIVGMKDASILVMIANKTEDGVSCLVFGDMTKRFAIMNLMECNGAE